MTLFNCWPQTLAAICRNMGIWDVFMLRPPGKIYMGFGAFNSDKLLSPNHAFITLDEASGNQGAEPLKNNNHTAKCEFLVIGWFLKIHGCQLTHSAHSSNWACRPSGHYCNNCPNALSSNEVTATHLIITHPQILIYAFRSPNELQRPDHMDSSTSNDFWRIWFSTKAC